jgi:hypothetical protein
MPRHATSEDAARNGFAAANLAAVAAVARPGLALEPRQGRDRATTIWVARQAYKAVWRTGRGRTARVAQLDARAKSKLLLLYTVHSYFVTLSTTLFA